MGYALDILENKNDIPRPFVSEWYNPVLMGAAGFGIFAFGNYLNRRPTLAGIHRHVIGLFAGIALGFYVNKKSDEHFAERDAVLRHYVQLHPEDFPDPERKKIGDMFIKWTPIR